MEQTDVVIVGTGAVGLCAAYYLKKSGCKVTILEKGAIANGCSSGNAGLIVPSHFVPLAAPGVITQGLKWMFNPESPFYIKPRFNTDLLSWLWKFSRSCNEAHVRRSMPLLRNLNMASRALFDDLEEALPVNFNLEKLGLFLLYLGDKGYRECIEMVEGAREVGLNAIMKTQEEIRSLDPAMNCLAKGGAFLEEDAHFTPSKFNQGLLEWLRQEGVVILPDTEVTGLLTSNKRIAEVETTRGNFSADEVVVASGVWSEELVRSLDISIPMQAGKGYSVTYKTDVKPRYPLLLAEAKVAVTPMGENLRLAGTMELAGNDLSINRRRIRAILRAVPQYIKNEPVMLEDAQIWAGLRPCSPDGLPYIGRSSKFFNLTIASGHAMIGMSTAPISGKLVSEIINDGKTGMDISMLAVDRYSR